MAASTRCSPGGPVPRPRPTTADAGRWRPEQRRRHPDDVSRRGARSNAHPAPLGSTSRHAISAGRRRRPAQARIADRSNAPIAPWAACRPRIPFTTKAWADGDRGRPTGQRAGSGPSDLITGGPMVAVGDWSVAVFAQTASRMPILRHVGSTTPWPRHSGLRRNDHAVLGRPRPPCFNDPGVYTPGSPFRAGRT